MKTIHFYLDFISPYAWLAVDGLPRALEGISHRVVHKPVVFGAMLHHHGQLGPAEMPSKRDWTYRQVQWQAQAQGTPLQLPASHPFNSLALLRLATACDADRLATLSADLKPLADVASAEVKQQLKAHTDEAIALDLFGVPSFVVDGQVFWGNDALPMLRAYLQGDPWFQSSAWTDVAQLPVGVRRKV